MKKLFLLTIFLNLSFVLTAQKEVYIPSSITNENMDLNDPNSQWCYCRSMETENIVVFWEPGFGGNPSTASGDYQVDVEELLAVAEESYAVYLDSLKFAVEGSSVTDDYKLMIFLVHSTEWAAYGSGEDNLVGTLRVNPAAARSNTVVAHEVGHCFQYITGCDTDGGYRYGYGPNGQGGNGFWEQAAQWQAFKVYPERQFSAGDFSNYIQNNHLHIFHEDVRYANYFILDYWTHKQGTDVAGRLWRESVEYEDPAQTYKRLNGLTQEAFNDEMYEHAARLTTWDIPHIRDQGQNYINSRDQVEMQLNEDDFWEIDSSVCIQNYGYNSIKLNAPFEETEVSVNFKGMAGAEAFNSINVDQGGWRYGFVALLEDGSRVYSDMATAHIENGTNPETTLSFTCPENCTNLWLVVSGAPQEYWKHPWDDNPDTDEQWPYQVQFENTNLLGVFDNSIHDDTLTYDISMDPASDYTPTTVGLNASRIGSAFSMSPDEIAAALGDEVAYVGMNPNGSQNPTSTANDPGHWYNDENQTVDWGDEAYVFSELNLSNMIADIGQYPDRCEEGDQFTIRQALVYTNSEGETAQVTLIFNISIGDDVITAMDESHKASLEIYPNPTSGRIFWKGEHEWKLLNARGNIISRGNGASANLSSYPEGIYFLQTEDRVLKVVKD